MILNWKPGLMGHHARVTVIEKRPVDPAELVMPVGVINLRVYGGVTDIDVRDENGSRYPLPDELGPGNATKTSPGDARRREVDECLSAMEDRDMVEVADGIIDSIYVLVGMGLELGLPLQALWEEVQRSNMAKAIEQPDGSFKVLKRADGKVIKPEGWTPPDIAGVLRAHGWKG